MKLIIEKVCTELNEEGEPSQWGVYVFCEDAAFIRYLELKYEGTYEIEKALSGNLYVISNEIREDVMEEAELFKLNVIEVENSIDYRDFNKLYQAVLLEE